MICNNLACNKLVKERIPASQVHPSTTLLQPQSHLELQPSMRHSSLIPHKN